MSPMKDTALGRMKRQAVSADKLWERAKTIAKSANSHSKVYGIYKTEQLPGTPNDFKIEGNL